MLLEFETAAPFSFSSQSNQNMTIGNLQFAEIFDTLSQDIVKEVEDLKFPAQAVDYVRTVSKNHAFSLSTDS